MRPLRRLPLLFVIWLALAAPPAPRAQGEPTLHAEVNRQVVGVGQPFTYTLRIEAGAAGINAKPSIPDFGDLRILGGPSQSSSTSIFNGRVSISQSYTWTLAAPREGTYIIGPSRMRGAGGLIESEAITITVHEQVEPRVVLPRGLPSDQILSARSAVGNTEVDQYLNGRLFLRPQISNTRPYVGEPVIVTYTLYNGARISLGQNTRAIMPDDFQGVVHEVLYSHDHLDYRPEMIDGQRFDVAPLYGMALIPTRPGVVEVGGYSIETRVNLPRGRGGFRDPFDDPMLDFFGGRGEPVQVPTRPIRLEVQPLPDAGQPDNFTGTVGDFTIAASLDRTEANENELVTLSVLLDGRGAIELASAPRFNSEAFELVGETESVNKLNTAEQLGGSKTFEFVLRPRATGRLEVPSIQYPIFDPYRGEYRILRTEPQEITIAAAPNAAQPQTPRSRTNRDEPGEPQLHWIKPITRLETKPAAPLVESAAVWGAQLSALALLLVAWRHDRRRARRDPARIRREAAPREFERRVQALRREPRDVRAEDLAGRLEQAVRHYVADLHGISADGLTRPEIESRLHAQGLSAERTAKVMELLDACAAVHYAPAPSSREQVMAWADELGGLLRGGAAG